MQEKLMEFLLNQGISYITTVEYHETISSTSDRIKLLFQSSDPKRLPCLVMAREQTAGRGRGNKVWWSGRGGLFFSLGFDLAFFPLQRHNLPLISLAIALSMIETLRPLLPKQHQPALRWPNDVCINNKKICGILVEVPEPSLVVLGIGLNVNNRPTDAPAEFRDTLQQRGVCSLVEILGKTTDMTVLLVDFLKNFQHHLQDEGFPSTLIRGAEQLCLQVGCEVSIKQNNRRISGHCFGLGSDGSLLLRTNRGVEAIYSGIVD